MLVLALALALAAPPGDPDLAVVVGRRVGMTPGRATALASQLEATLAGASIRTLPPVTVARRLGPLGVKDPSVCMGKLACLTELGRQLRVTRLISISLAELKPDLSITLELIDVTEGKRVSQATLLLPVETTDVSADLQSFVEQVARALDPPTAVAVPVPVPVSPPSSPPEPLAVAPLVPVEAAPTSTRPPALKWLAGAGAVAAAGTSVGFFIARTATASALTGKPTLTPDAMQATEYTHAQAAQLANSANSQTAVSVACGILSGFLIAATIYLFASE